MPDSVIRPGLFGDAIIGVVDGIRGTIRAALGTRSTTVTVIKRRWSGGVVGSGSSVDEEMELTPPPMFTEGSSRFRQSPGGREDDGDAVLTEVSLRYTEAELDPQGDRSMEVAYRVREAHGQGASDRYYVLAGKPRARRGDHTGDRSDWEVPLRETTTFATSGSPASP